MRHSLMITAAAVLSLLTAGCAESAPVAAPSPTDPAPSAVATGLPPAEQTIPAAALLQSDDLGGATPERASADRWAHLAPPNPCGTRPAADGRELAAATQQATYTLDGAVERPTVIVEHVARYEGGADSVLRAIRAAVKQCPGPTGALQRRWTIAQAGEDTLLLEVSHKGELGGSEVTHTTVVGVAAAGDAVVVVADAGWENRSGDAALVRKLLPVAVERAGAVA